MADGSTVIVDEAYVIESLADPNAKITQGFTAGIMPKDFDEKLSEPDIEATIAYMRSLKKRRYAMVASNPGRQLSSNLNDHPAHSQLRRIWLSQGLLAKKGIVNVR